MLLGRAALCLVGLIIWQTMAPATLFNVRQVAPLTGSGSTHCEEYSNRVSENGKCTITATLPQQDGQRCPDMFRCTDEVSYWLHENGERKREILELRELLSEMMEELRNHRHRIKVLEEQPEALTYNSSVIHQLHNLENWARESSTLQRMQATFIYDIQAQVRNLSLMMDLAMCNTSCLFPDVPAAEQTKHQADLGHITCYLSDCSEIYRNGIRQSGVYTTTSSVGAVPTKVYCDMETDGGGWSVIQRRQDGSVSFNKTWREYREGFGNFKSEFWLGNEDIYRLTHQGGYSLRIDLEDWNGNHNYAFYRDFRIENEENDYRLHVEGYSGTAGDSFAWYHDKMSFSTPDSRNVCAKISRGGWWYHQCFYANLNGVYYTGGRYLKSHGKIGPDGIVWYSWRNTDYYSLKKVSMMIRPRTFHSHPSP